jgi:hypothetical protein
MKTTLNAFLSPYSSLTPADLASGKDEIAKGLFYHSNAEFVDGYTLVGTAEVEVTLLSMNDVIEQKRQAIEAQLQRDIADSEVRHGKLREQIRQLLALPGVTA